MGVQEEVPVDRVGIILVHGIGDQRRFEHLDSQTRDLIRAFQSMPGVTSVSVDISGSGAAAFQAQQDTWTAGPEPSVMIVIHYTQAGESRICRCGVHEVWWADVNEPYSLAKQFRFWLWALAVWRHPGKARSGFGTSSRVFPPQVKRSLLLDRVRLFLLGAFFALVGFSIGILTFVANRILNWQTPDILRVLTNYVSAVKLYNQRRRFGPGLVWTKEEFIDAVDEPPRVSVRRRMIRTIADVACYDDPEPYDRWYVLAHSQGSVVAFNGLMETAYSWPGYLDETRWTRLKAAGLAGPRRPGMLIPQPPFMPRRPGWASESDIAYRSRIFERFRGFLTYGSPLEKFAGLWPALVPISREPAFKPDIPWINLYDPIDPVSGRLLAFSQQPAECCPHPQDVGYCASGWLLLAHLKYLTQRDPLPHGATATVHWLVSDSTAQFMGNPSGWRPGRWFANDSTERRARTVVNWCTWAIAAIVLSLAGAIVFPMVLDALGSVWSAVANEFTRLFVGGAVEANCSCSKVRSAFSAVGFWKRVVLILASAGVLTAIVGFLAGAIPYWFFRPDNDVPVDKPKGRSAARVTLDRSTFAVESDEPDHPAGQERGLLR